MAAILRATNEAGETWDDPSEDLLFELLAELGPGNSFLIVDRLEPERADHFMQTMMGGDGEPYLLEYREGPKDTHRSTWIASMRTVHEVLTKWAFEVPGWQDGLTWTPVRY